LIYDYIDIELLSEIQDTTNIQNAMEDTKRYLHKNNIAYIDWKYENIGIDEEGNFKLFDFNGSGIFNCYNEWIFQPPPFYVMRNAPDGLTPIEIDNWAFTHFNYSFSKKDNEDT
jgi:serine/threonine protein kinase